MSRKRRAHYTRAGDVEIKDAETGQTVGRQRRYSPSELNSVRSGRKPRKVRRTAKNKRQTNAAHRRYLETINADN